MKKINLLLLLSSFFIAHLTGQINNLMTDDPDFFPEDITIVNDIAYVSGLGDGTVKMFNLNLANPEGETFAAAEEGFTQGWGLKSDGTILLSLLNNADFTGGESGPAKLVQYDIASRTKTAEWDLPAGAIGHTVSIVDGKYYVTDFGSPRIMEIDPSTNMVNDSWFTSEQWDPTISGIGGTIYNNAGGFYISQGNKLWYLPISEGMPGTLQEVAVTGLEAIDADGISWDDTKNILYFATNDTGDPENAGIVSRVVFSGVTTATGSVIGSGYDDSSGLWFHRVGGKEYVFVLESQFGALFGINSFESPFNIEVIELPSSSNTTISVFNSFEDATLTGGQQAFYGAAGPVGISNDVEFPQFINFYNIDVTDFGLTMTLFNNSDAADLVLPEGRFDRYYFAYDGDVSNISISGGSPGLADNATVTPLPAGYEIPLADLFATGFPLPITLPNGGFVLELGGGTDLTELGQTISVDFGFTGISVFNSFEDATLTGGQQAFYGAAGPTPINDNVEFPQFINFYDIDVTDCGLIMTLFNNSDAADLVLPEGRFDRYYFAIDQDMSSVSVSGGSSGLANNATVTPLPAGYEIPLADLFETGFPLPITLPNGGFVLELGGGTDLTELGQTISVDFGCPIPASITINDAGFFPEDIFIVNDVAYVSGLGDGTVRTFDLSQSNPTAELFAAAEEGFTQGWGLKSDGKVLLSLLNNADFTGGESGSAKLVQYDITSKTKTAEWDLPAGAIGHTVSIVDGKYYVTDFGSPRIMEIDPSTNRVNESWFTSAQWDPTISGIGGTIYNNAGGFYISQGNKLWYLPISEGMPGTLQEVAVTGLEAIDADGISWDDANNTLYYATNDTGDPANVGTVYRLVFSDATTATGSIIATGFDDSSGLWYYEKDGKEYVYLLESQFGALFGINSFEPPFNIAIIPLGDIISSTNNVLATTSQINVYPNPTNQTATFEIELTEGGDFTFQVFNITGKEVFRQTVQLMEGLNTFPFHSSHLETGIYNYQLSSNQGFVNGKLIITK
ncbi:MAG: T9SS type A sorting domain-containing protein [Bacteroidota bacterium]